jgi:hypothetical protein
MMTNGNKLYKIKRVLAVLYKTLIAKPVTTDAGVPPYDSWSLHGVQPSP